MSEKTHNAYRWTMTFESGAVHHGMASTTPFNPNDIPKNLGQLKTIKLTPSKDFPHLQAVTFHVPYGKEGFHNRDVVTDGATGRLLGLRFRLGYREAGRWIALSVNVADGSLEIEEGI